MSSAALVLGTCSHALSVIRALHGQGVTVYAVDTDARLGGHSAAIARLFLVPSLDEDAIVAALRDLRPRIAATRVVLCATNDNHVRALATRFPDLADQYLLSWADSREHMLRLQKKDELERISIDQGLHYPKSAVLDSMAALAQVEQFGYPVILKPVRPLSSFKTALAHTPGELAGLVRRYQADLPLVAQEYIAGDDTSLYFGALTLDHGRVVQGMVGRKLASHPPARGQTTVAETVDEPEVLRLTEQFFAGFGLSGPVSLELKRGPDGRYWVIEPTVGRTDFWSELCIAAGFNQPWQEYLLALGEPLPAPAPLRAVSWYDCERAPLAYWRAALAQRTFRPYGKPAYFPFLRRGDWQPFLRACVALARARVTRLAGSAPARASRLFPLDQALPPALADWLAGHQRSGMFGTPEWFTTLARFETMVQPRRADARFGWLVVFDGAAPCVAAPVTWRRGRAGRRELDLLSNYYTPRIDLVFDPASVSARAAWERLLPALEEHFRGWLALTVDPLAPAQADDLEAAARARGLAVNRFARSTNYFCSVEDLDSYWAARPSQLQNTLRRKGKALTRADHRFEITSQPTPEQVAAYWHSYNKSWKHKEPNAAFINWLLDWGAAHGHLRLGLLHIDGRVAASQLWLVEGARAHIFKLAQDREADRHSPGSLLTQRMIEHVRTVDQVKVIDFLLGTDPYKQLWMDQSHPVYGVEIINRRTLAGRLLLAYQAVRRQRAPRPVPATAPEALAGS